MSKKQIKKQYTEEFKRSSCQLVIESSKSLSETARELGIASSTLHTWVNKYYPEKGETKVLSEDIHQELKQLKKELTRVKQERDILKKATAYFAKLAQ